MALRDDESTYERIRAKYLGNRASSAQEFVRTHHSWASLDTTRPASGPGAMEEAVARWHELRADGAAISEALSRMIRALPAGGDGGPPKVEVGLRAASIEEAKGALEREHALWREAFDVRIDAEFRQMMAVLHARPTEEDTDAFLDVVWHREFTGYLEAFQFLLKLPADPGEKRLIARLRSSPLTALGPEIPDAIAECAPAFRLRQDLQALLRFWVQECETLCATGWKFSFTEEQELLRSIFGEPSGVRQVHELLARLRTVLADLK